MNTIRLKLLPVLTILTILIASCSPAVPATSAEKPTSIPTTAPTPVIEETPTLSQAGLPLTEAEVPRVAVAETVAAMQNGEAVVVDVRDAQSYQAGHIPGALSIPLKEIETNPTGLNLDKDQWIITYCT